jgi:hypothetical protein
LDKAVIKAIESWKKKVDIALWYIDCSDDDETIIAFLKKNGYENISVKSDYPWYCESYEWRTNIKFTF